MYVLDSCLRLLHPFMPFITEEVWQRLPHEGPSLMIADWPQRDDEPLCVPRGPTRSAQGRPACDHCQPVSPRPLHWFPSLRVRRPLHTICPPSPPPSTPPSTPISSLIPDAVPRFWLCSCVDADAEQRFGSLQALVRSVRNARAEYRVEPGKLIAATVIAGELEPTLAAETEAITSLARIDPAAFSFQGADAEGADGAVVRLVVEDSLEAVLPLAGLVDSDKERVRLGKQQTKLEASIAKVSKRLEAPGFVDKAPPAVLEKARTELAEQEEQLQGVLDALKQLP